MNQSIDLSPSPPSNFSRTHTVTARASPRKNNIKTWGGKIQKVDKLLIRSGERKDPDGDKAEAKKAKKKRRRSSNDRDGDANYHSDNSSPASVGDNSPKADGADGDDSDVRGGAGGGAKAKKDWVRYDGAAMLLSSAGWSDDEDEEKEELITSEIEKFRQKQVGLACWFLVGRGGGGRLEKAVWSMTC